MKIPFINNQNLMNRSLGRAQKNPYRINCKGSIDMAVTYSPTLLCSTIGHEGHSTNL